MKSIESVVLIGLIGLIESNQINQKFTACAFFRHYFNSIHIEGPKTIFFFSCVLRKQKTLYQDEFMFLY